MINNDQKRNMIIIKFSEQSALFMKQLAMKPKYLAGHQIKDIQKYHEVM